MTSLVSKTASNSEGKGTDVLWFGPFPAPRNGIDEYARVILASLPTTVTASTKRLSFANWPLDYPQQVVSALLHLARAARRRPLIHIQYCAFSTGPAAMLVVILARVFGLKVVCTLHEDKSSMAAKNRVLAAAYALFENVLLSFCQRIIVHSQWQKSHLPKSAQQKAEVIEFGVNRLSRGRPRTASKHHVGCFGIITPHKCIETVIEACHLASKEVPGLRLTIAGTVSNPSKHGGYLQYLRDLLQERLGDRGILLTDVLQDEFDALQEDVDVVCFGLRRATQSTTVYRAIGHLKPVVVTDAGGVGEVVRNEGLGVVVPIDDVKAMSDGIVHLLTDRQAYEQARTAIRTYAKIRTWRANAEAHARIYTQLVA